MGLREPVESPGVLLLRQGRLHHVPQRVVQHLPRDVVQPQPYLSVEEEAVKVELDGR